MLLYRV